MIVKKGTYPVQRMEHMKDGEGVFVAEHLVPRELLGKAGRMFVLGTLEKGCTVGSHTHEGDMEICYCVAGHGVVIEEDGVETPFEVGDTNIVPNGHTHEIRNITDEPLQYIAVVLYP